MADCNNSNVLYYKIPYTVLYYCNICFCSPGMPGSTKKTCACCKAIINVAFKTCPACKTGQPYKAKLQKRREKFKLSKSDWVASIQKNCNMTVVVNSSHCLVSV